MTRYGRPDDGRPDDDEVEVERWRDELDAADEARDRALDLLDRDLPLGVNGGLLSAPKAGDPDTHHSGDSASLVADPACAELFAAPSVATRPVPAGEQVPATHRATAATGVPPAPVAATHLELTERDAIRFRRKVRVGGADECWTYNGAHFEHGGGYPAFWLASAGQNVGGHRVACTLAHGPSDQMALHSCDNPKCVNPNHLRWGTNTENQQDRSARGRAPIGEGHARSVVTAHQVAAMRERHAAGESIAALAREYGTSESNVSFIVKRQTWRHVA